MKETAMKYYKEHVGRGVTDCKLQPFQKQIHEINMHSILSKFKHYARTSLRRDGSNISEVDIHYGS